MTLKMTQHPNSDYSVMPEIFAPNFVRLFSSRSLGDTHNFMYSCIGGLSLDRQRSTKLISSKPKTARIAEHVERIEISQTVSMRNSMRASVVCSVFGLQDSTLTYEFALSVS